MRIFNEGFFYEKFFWCVCVLQEIETRKKKVQQNRQDLEDVKLNLKSQSNDEDVSSTDPKDNLTELICLVKPSLLQNCYISVD